VDKLLAACAVSLIAGGCSAIDVRRLPDGWLRAESRSPAIAIDFPPGARPRDWSRSIDGALYQIEQIEWDRGSQTAPVARVATVDIDHTLEQWRNGVRNNSSSDPTFDAPRSVTVCGAAAQSQSADTPESVVDVLGGPQARPPEWRVYRPRYFYRAVELTRAGRPVVVHLKIREDRRDPAAEDRFFASITCPAQK
jgi:hypothetical protein